MKWLTVLVISFTALQSAWADYGIVDSTREGTARFLIMMNNASQFQNPTAGQLLALMQRDPRTVPLFQYLNLSVPFGNDSYRSISSSRLSQIPDTTSVQVSTSESQSHRLEQLSQSYNRLADSKISQASKAASEKDYKKASMDFAKGLQFCQKEIRNPKFGLDEKDVMSNWMFLRRRLEILSAECKAGILASGGSDRSSNKALENRPGQITGTENNFTQKYYGSALSGNTSGRR